MPHQMSMRRTLLAVAPLLVLASLLVAPYAAAQAGGAGTGPVEGAEATVQYVLNQTSPPPGNGTQPPGNTTSPPDNSTAPPGNTTSPPANETAPGNTTTPPADTTPENTTSPPGNTTTPPANTTAPPGNATSPPANSTSPPGNATAPGNSTASGNETASGGAGGGSDAAGNSTEATCTTCPTTDNSTLQGDGFAGWGGAMPCRGLACDRSRTIVGTVKPGFPWLPLLLTLILAPLVGLAVARYAIHRWHLGAKPSRRKAAAKADPVTFRGAPDAHDPMRKFLMDVKEWRALPQAGSPESHPMPLE